MFLPDLTRSAHSNVAVLMLKCYRLSGFSDVGLLRQAHPFSQQAIKAASHTDLRCIYLAPSSADARLSGPSAGRALIYHVRKSADCFLFFNLTTAAPPNVFDIHSNS